MEEAIVKEEFESAEIKVHQENVSLKIGIHPVGTDDPPG